MEHVNQYQTALYRFTDSLPEQLKLSVANVDAHILRPDRPSYTMLHTWYCQTHIELYSFSLHALKRSTTNDSVPWEFFLRSHQDFLLRSQQQAVSYAICLAQTWEYSLQNIKKNPSASLRHGLVTVDWMVGACAVDVVEVLLAARKYKLYENLRGNTSAQMVSRLFVWLILAVCPQKCYMCNLSWGSASTPEPRIKIFPCFTRSFNADFLKLDC